jgi:hypothetical protein
MCCGAVVLWGLMCCEDCDVLWGLYCVVGTVMCCGDCNVLWGLECVVLQYRIMPEWDICFSVS